MGSPAIRHAQRRRELLDGFQLDTDFPNPDHAAQQQRRRRGNP
ncbi:hypothetical protein [Streptomyces sp. MT206]